MFADCDVFRRRSRQLSHTRRGVHGGVACASPLCGLHDYHVAQHADHLGDLGGALPTPAAPGSSKPPAAVGGGAVSAATSPGGDPGYASCPTTENDYFQTWQLQRHAMPPSARRAQPYPVAGIQRPVPGMLPFAAETTTQPGRPYVEHIYESPKFERREFVPPPPTSMPAAAHPGSCVCCGPPTTQAAPSTSAAAVSRCLQYVDSEQNAAAATRL